MTKRFWFLGLALLLSAAGGVRVAPAQEVTDCKAFSSFDEANTYYAAHPDAASTARRRRRWHRVRSLFWPGKTNQAGPEHPSQQRRVYCNSHRKKKATSIVKISKPRKRLRPF